MVVANTRKMQKGQVSHEITMHCTFCAKIERK